MEQNCLLSRFRVLLMENRQFQGKTLSLGVSQNPLRKWISLKFPILPCSTLNFSEFSRIFTFSTPWGGGGVIRSHTRKVGINVPKGTLVQKFCTTNLLLILSGHISKASHVFGIFDFNLSKSLKMYLRQYLQNRDCIEEIIYYY